jgi:hypothetical protein
VRDTVSVKCETLTPDIAFSIAHQHDQEFCDLQGSALGITIFLNFTDDHVPETHIVEAKHALNTLNCGCLSQAHWTIIFLHESDHELTEVVPGEFVAVVHYLWMWEVTVVQVDPFSRGTVLFKFGEPVT